MQNPYPASDSHADILNSSRQLQEADTTAGNPGKKVGEASHRPPPHAFAQGPTVVGSSLTIGMANWSAETVMRFTSDPWKAARAR